MACKQKKKRARGRTRRSVLKGAAATAGLAAGAGAITGFPMVWAQELKEITIHHVGAPYSAIIDIANQANGDLPFKVEMQALAHDALRNRLVTQPKTVDIADTEYFFLQQLVPRGDILQPVDLDRFEYWDGVVPIFTKGEYPDGSKVSD